jgi:hypothetical protein
VFVVVVIHLSVAPRQFCRFQLLAGVNVDSFDASLALDVTAPVEFALATLFDRRLERVVTSSAAHEIAAVHPGRRPIARPAVSTWNSK